MATDTLPLALRTDAEGRTCVDVPVPNNPLTAYEWLWLDDDGAVRAQFAGSSNRVVLVTSDIARAIAMLVNARDGAGGERECECDELRAKLTDAEREAAILRSDLADATRDLAARQQRESAPGAPPVRCTSCRRWVDEMEVVHGTGHTLRCLACARLDGQHQAVEELQAWMRTTVDAPAPERRDALARVREQVEAKLRRENSLPARVALANVLDIIDAEANRG